MSIPDFQALMLPLLRLTSDGQEHRWSDCVAELARESGLSESKT